MRFEGLPQEEGAEELSDIEKSANYEGNDSELLFSRLENPLIKKQLVEIVRNKRIEEIRSYKDEDWEDYLPEGWTGEEKFKLKKGVKSGRVRSVEDLEEWLNMPEPSEDEVEKDIDSDIERVKDVTEINFGSHSPTAKSISLDWIMPWTGEKPNEKQMSIIAAHEKGHNVRFYREMTPLFLEGFDLSAVRFTDEYFEMLKREKELDPDLLDEEKEISFDEMKDIYLNTYLFTGHEIAERMSQLKNYFGFKGAEEFTKEHLDYARENYIKDTNMNNAMDLFFEAITPEKEEAFLRLINTMGI